MFVESDLHSAAGFLTAAECANLVAIFDGDPKPKDSYWDNRVMYPKLWSADIKKKIKAADKIVRAALGRVLWGPLNPVVVCWPDGHAGMDSHLDVGARGQFPWREFAGLVRLNDGYSGGETEFPDLGVSRKLPVGDLLLYPGGEMRHGVTAVSGGDRYMLAFWFACASEWKFPPEPGVR